MMTTIMMMMMLLCCYFVVFIAITDMLWLTVVFGILYEIKIKIKKKNEKK